MSKNKKVVRYRKPFNVNIGLIGFFRFDLVAFIFGNMSWFSRIIYALVGLGGLYLISLFGRIRSVDQA